MAGWFNRPNEGIPEGKFTVAFWFATYDPITLCAELQLWFYLTSNTGHSGGVLMSWIYCGFDFFSCWAALTDRRSTAALKKATMNGCFDFEAHVVPRGRPTSRWCCDLNQEGENGFIKKRWSSPCWGWAQRVPGKRQMFENTQNLLFAGQIIS